MIKLQSSFYCDDANLSWQISYSKISTLIHIFELLVHFYQLIVITDSHRQRLSCITSIPSFLLLRPKL